MIMLKESVGVFCLLSTQSKMLVDQRNGVGCTWPTLWHTLSIVLVHIGRWIGGWTDGWIHGLAFLSCIHLVVRDIY